MTSERPARDRGSTLSPYRALAPAYDGLVGLRDFSRTRAWFERLLRRYRIGFSSAVDLGCGTGLFTRYLRLCFGVPVLGVDRSRPMLDIARRNCRGSGVRFLNQDLRRLRLPFPVDLATSNTMTFNHLLTPLELRTVFRGVHQALRPGGHLIFDLLTDRQPLEPGKQYASLLGKGCGCFVQMLRWHPRTCLLTLVMAPHDSRRQAPEVYLGRGYPPALVGRCLASSGFSVRGCHTAGSDPLTRVVMVARRS